MVEIRAGEGEPLHPTSFDDVELYHPQKLADEICLFAGRQDHRHPICRDGDFHRPGRAGAVMADAPATGVPGRILAHRSKQLLPVHHHARHDHGGLSADRAFPRRLRQLPHPLDDRRARHGVSLCQHAELLDLSTGGAGAGRQLLRSRRIDGRRLDALSPASPAVRHARPAMGHHPDVRLADPVHHRLHHGRPQLRGHGAAIARQGHDDDAAALDRVGHFHRDGDGAAGLSRPVRRLGDDAVRPSARHQFLHADDRRERPASGLFRRQPDPVPASVLVLRPPRGLHRGAAGFRHCLRPDQHPRAEKHLWLPDDGLGHRHHRRAQLRRVGPPHVCERNGSEFRLLLRHQHLDHRRPHRDQGL